MTAHIHAQAMADYSEDALKTDKPWELWEYNTKHSDDWHRLYRNPQWDVDVTYRRKKAVNPKITAFKLLKQIDEKAAKWIKEHGFKKGLNESKKLSCLFIFNEKDISTKGDGVGYWSDIQEKLEAAIEEHGI